MTMWNNGKQRAVRERDHGEQVRSEEPGAPPSVPAKLDQMIDILVQIRDQQREMYHRMTDLLDGNLELLQSQHTVQGRQLEQIQGKLKVLDG